MYGAYGKSYVYASDFAWTQNIGVFGGITYDSSLNPYGTDYPFFIGLTLSGGITLWAHYMDSQIDSYIFGVTSMRINTVGTKFVVAYNQLSNSPNNYRINFQTMYTVSGVIINSFYIEDFYYDIEDGAMVIDSNDILYFVNERDSNYYFCIHAVNLVTATVVFQKQFSNEQYEQYRMELFGSYLIAIGYQYDISKVGTIYKISNTGTLAYYKEHYLSSSEFTCMGVDVTNNQIHLGDNLSNFYMTDANLVRLYGFHTSDYFMCKFVYVNAQIGYFMLTDYYSVYVQAFDWLNAQTKMYKLNTHISIGYMMTGSITWDSSSGFFKAFVASEVQSIYEIDDSTTYNAGYQLPFINGFNIGTAGQSSCLPTVITPISILTLSPQLTSSFVDLTTYYTYSSFTKSVIATSYSILSLTSIVIQPISTWCTLAKGTIATGTTPAQSYEVTATPLTFTATDFTFTCTQSPTFSCSNNVLTYAATISPSTALPSFISFNPATLGFSVSSSSVADAGTYTIRITVTDNFASTSVYSTFVLTVLNDVACGAATLSSASYASQTYNLHDTAITLPLSAFTSSQSSTYCGAFTYTATSDSSGSLNSALFVFSTSPFQLQITGTSPSLAGSHYVDIVGHQGSYTSNTYTLRINVQVVNLCTTAVLSSTTYSAQTYQINSGAQPLTISPFTSTVSVGYCGAFVYNVANNAPTSSIFTWAFPTLTLTTSDPGQIGTWTVTITGYQGTYTSQASSVQITYTIRDDCPTATISSATYTAQTYYLHDAQQPLTLSAFTSTVSSNYCGAFAYTAVNDGTNALDTGLFTFTPGTRVLTIGSTTSLGYIGSHTVTVTGYQGTYSALAYSITINYQVIDYCASAVLSTASYSTQTYNLHDSSLVVPLSAFTSTVSSTYCGAMTYTAFSDGLISFDSTLFAFSSGAMTVSLLTTTNSAYIGTHTVTIQGYQATYPSNMISTTITFTVVDLCTAAVLTPAADSSQTYNLHDSTLVVPLSAFTSTVSSTYCGAMTYTAFSDGLISFDSTLFAFSSGAMTISLLTTTNSAYIGTHTVTIQGYQATYPSNMVSTTITFNVVDLCATAVLTPAADSSQTYNLHDPQIDVPLSTFTSTVSAAYCGAMTYVAYSDGLISFDSVLFSFASGSLTVSLPQTSNSAYIGTHSVTIQGYQATYPSNKVSTTITFTIVDLCLTATITPPTIPDQSYTLFDTAIVLNTGFTSTIASSYCGLFVYTVKNDAKVVLDSQVFTFDSVALTLTIYSTNSTYSGTHTITIKGQQGTYSAQAVTISFLVTVIDSCASAQITYTSVGSQLYHIYDDQLVIPIALFTESIFVCGKLYYYATLDSGQSLDSSVMQFSLSMMQFTVQSDDYLKTGTYTLQLHAAYNNPLYPTATLSITLTIDCLINSFQIGKVIPNQNFLLGSVPLLISVTDFSQSPKCGYSVTYQATQASGTALPAYISYDSQMNRFNVMTLDQAPSTSVTVKLLGSITDPQHHTAFMTFTLTFIGSLSSSSSSGSQPLIVINSTTSTDSSSTEGASGESKEVKVKFSERFARNVSKQVLMSSPNQFKAYISGVTTKGLATIKFTRQVIVPENYTDFDSSILDVKFLKSDNTLNATLIGWTITGFLQSSFILLLSFDNPLEVSQSYVSICFDFQLQDNVEVVFLDNYFFQSNSTSEGITYLQYLCSTKKTIPPQVANSSNNKQFTFRCNEYIDWRFRFSAFNFERSHDQQPRSLIYPVIYKSHLIGLPLSASSGV